MKRKFIYRIFILLILYPQVTLSQDGQKADERLKVFIDCSNTWCDYTFIKTEINVVDFLHDRLSADVHVLITSQGTGGGGMRYQMIFYGQNRFSLHTDTLRYNVKANSTDTESRELMLKYLKLGLVPFITKTGLVENITIGMKQDSISGKPGLGEGAMEDQWNYWVITVRTDGDLSSEKAYKGFGFNGNLSANRVTPELKLGFSVYGSNNKTTYYFETDSSREKFVAKNSYYGFQHHYVKSLNDHWSAGYEAIFNSSTFSNFKRQLYIRAAVEYNIYPYAEINNRSFTFSYGFISRFNRYYDTTLYDKLKENLLAHSFKVNLTLNKKWGTANAGIFYTNYLHDWNLNSLGVNLFANIRITGGLSLYLHSSGELVHDQIYLPKAGATEQEVLTRLRQLKSSYRLQNRVGLSYRFGSKLNNFVNPRFDGG